MVPVDIGTQSIDQRGQLLGTQKGRRTTAEVDESKRAVAHDGLLADQFDFLAQRRDVGLNVFCVLIGEDFEVTKFATLAAEGNVQVQPERRIGDGRPGHRLGDFVQLVCIPFGVRRIVGNEVATDFCFCGFGHGVGGCSSFGISNV